jgi:hypothetical protein
MTRSEGDSESEGEKGAKAKKTATHKGEPSKNDFRRENT